MRPYLLSVIFISNISLAQVDSEGEKIPDPHRFYLGLMAAPEVTDGLWTSIDNTVQGNQDFWNQIFSAKLGCTAGIDLLFLINHRFTFQSGFYYSNKGYRVKKFYLTDMYGVAYDPEAYKTKINSHYLEIPLKINYNIHFENFKCYFSGGLINAFLAGRTSTDVLYFQNGNVEHNTNKEVSDATLRFNLFPTIGTGFDFFINSKMTFRIEPTAKLSILKLYSDSISKTHLWSAGVNFSYLIGL